MHSLSFYVRYFSSCEITSSAPAGTSILNIFSNPDPPHSRAMLFKPNSLVDSYGDVSVPKSVTWSQDSKYKN